MKNRFAKYILALIIFCLVLVLAFSNISNINISNINISNASLDFDDFPENEHYDLEWLLPPVNNEAISFSEGRAWVREKENGPWTLYDEEGNVIKSGFEADGFHEYKDGHAVFWESTESGRKLHGFVDLSGNIVLHLADYGGFVSYGDGLIEKRDTNGLSGYINYEGDWVIPPQFRSAHPFHDGMALVRRESMTGKRGYIDKEGNAVTDEIFEDAGYFSHGAARVQIDSLYGLIDKTGNYLLEPVYERLAWRLPNVFHVVRDGKESFIDRQGNKLPDFAFKKYSFETGFRKGRALVNLDKTSERAVLAVIDESGEIIYRLDDLKVRRRSMNFFNGDNFPVINENNQSCIIDREGRVIELPKFMDGSYVLRALDNNIIFVRKIGKDGNYAPGFQGYLRLIPKGGNLK